MNENFAYGEIYEQSFSNPHPRSGLSHECVEFPATSSMSPLWAFPVASDSNQ